MEIHRLDRAALKHEYGVDSQRLLPWAALNAPFEGAYAVVRPGTSSTPHSHHEYELFIATRGSAFMVADGRRQPFLAGDAVYCRPGQRHEVVNEGAEDFEFFSVWWDGAMGERFAERHLAEHRGGTDR